MLVKKLKNTDYLNRTYIFPGIDAAFFSSLGLILVEKKSYFSEK